MLFLSVRPTLDECAVILGSASYARMTSSLRRGQFARKALVREIPVVQGRVHGKDETLHLRELRGRVRLQVGTSRYKYLTRKHLDEIIHPHPSSCVWIHTRPLPNLLSETVKRHADAGKES